MHPRHWLLLIVCQSLWAGSYVAMKKAGAEMPVGVVVALRYGLASLLLLPWLVFRKPPRYERNDLALIALIGALNFALAPSLQVGSLRYTSAIDVSILIALEPLITVLGAALLLREKLTRITWIALAAGTLGMVILSGAGASAAEGGGALRLLGNVMFVGSLLFEAALTVSGGRLAPRYPAFSLIAAMKLAGFLTAVVVYSPILVSFPYGGITTGGWLSIAYLAVGPSVAAYTLWYAIIRRVPVNQVALSLFVQPVVGSALGYFLLGERIEVHTAVGAALICASLIWWQTRLSIAGRRA